MTPQFLQDLFAKNLVAWERLYDRYSPGLYGLILQYVAAEIAVKVLEDVFIEMYDRIHEYQVEKERLFTWMFKLTLFRCASIDSMQINQIK